MKYIFKIYAKNLVISTLLLLLLLVTIACGKNTLKKSNVSSNSLEEFGAFGDGYPDDKSPCRQLGESEKTINYLDHTKTLVGCPGSSKDQASKRILSMSGAMLVDEIDGISLITINHQSSDQPISLLTEEGYDFMIIGSDVKGTPLLVEENDLPDNTSCAYARIEDEQGLLLFMIVDEKIARIDVRESKHRLPNGLGIGSSADEIKNLYGDKTSIFPNKYDPNVKDYEVSLSKDRGLVFNVRDDKVHAYRLGKIPEVNWVEGCL